MKFTAHFLPVFFLAALLTTVSAQSPENPIEQREASIQTETGGPVTNDQHGDDAEVFVDYILDAANKDRDQLTAEEQDDLEEAEFMVKAVLENPPWEGATGLLVPVVAIIFTFGLPVMILAVVLYSRHKKRKQRNEVIALFLEKDREIPDKLLTHYDIENNKGSLGRGLVLCAAGIGIALTLGFLSGPVYAALGALPFCIGIAYLAIWRLHETKNSNPV